MKRTSVLGPLVAAFFFAAAVMIQPASAAEISIPIGDWASGIANALIAIVPPISIAILTWAANKYANVKIEKTWSDYIVGLETDALQAANNRLQAKIPDKLVVPTQSELLAEAAKWIIETEGPALVKWFGGAEGIKKWLESKITLQVAAGT